MKGLYHVDIERMCREMHEYACRVLIDELENPFETCCVVYRYTTFRTRISLGISLGPLSYDPAYEITRLFKETLNEARKKLGGARVFDVSVVIQDNPHEFARVLEIRLKHAEIPQVVLVDGQAMGTGPGPAAKPLHRLQNAPVSVKPSRQLTD